MRWKAKPFVDALSNVFYIIPGWITYYAMGGTGWSWLVLLAGWMWTTPMHVFSAIPDIDADTQAGLATTATALGVRNSLIYCMLWWFVSGIVAYSYL
jgi:4-hydroxybenzoate polyprenyltransferase